MYLHYVPGLFAGWWRRRHARGEVIIVRFAGDFVAGFRYEQDARRFLADLRPRLAKSGLEPHPDKTRLTGFGRFAAGNRAARGQGKPESSGFPGFNCICGTTRNGRFQLKRITIARRLRAKLAEVKAQPRRRMHDPVPEQGRWLASVVRGHMAYYAVPGNVHAVAAFRDQVTRHWLQVLRRRNCKHRTTWQRMKRTGTRWLPPARVTHPYPNVRFDARTQGRSPVR